MRGRRRIGSAFMLTCLIFIAAISIPSVLAAGSTFHVDDDYSPSTPGWGSTHFNSIQDAVGAASNYDTIIVHDGTYTEYVSVTKQLTALTIKSMNGPDVTVVQASGTNPVFYIAADYVSLIGFTVSGSQDGGILLDSARYAIIAHNVITKNTAGIIMFNSNDSTFVGNTVEANSIIGIQAYNSNDNTFICNTVRNNNYDTQGWGFLLTDSSGNAINYNRIYGHLTNGVENAGPSVNAEYNWWGAGSGPGPVGPGTGDHVSASVDFDPWLTGPPPPTVESDKDEYQPSETVRIAGSGYSAGTTYNLYIVEDTDWSNGMPIPSTFPGAVAVLVTDANGNIPPGTEAWSSAVPGEYDIIIDVNGNGKYDECIDALDDGDIIVTVGFFVVPELYLGTITALLSALAALVLYRKGRLINLKT